MRKLDGKQGSPLSPWIIVNASTSALAPFGPIPQPDKSKEVRAVLNIIVSCLVRDPFKQRLGVSAFAIAAQPSSPILGFFPR